MRSALQHRAHHRPQIVADLAFEFQQQAFSRLLADAGHLHQPTHLLRRHGARQVLHAHARQNGQRRARPHTGDLDQLPKRLPLRSGGKTIQNLRVLAHHEVRQQRHFFAAGGQVVERAHGHIHLVAHAVAVEQDLRGGFFQQRAGQLAYHWGFPFLRIIGLILRHTFSPPDNVRMAHLCGPMDAHIRSIEAALQVKVAHRFEQFRVEGPKAKAQQALEVIQALYEMARTPIAAEQVQLMLSGDTALPDDGVDAVAMQTRRGEVQGRTANQKRYLAHMATHDITFGIGPAGTGKTYLAVACAVDALERSAVQRIVLTRPAVEAGERLGFLPGDLTQKVDPYLRPLYDALYDLMGFDKVQKAFERQQIEIAPLAFMRGRTLNHAFVILDEAQNTTPEQMKMFLTRIGFGSKAVVTGDVSQIDLPRTQLSGLIDAERVLKRVKGIAFDRLTSADVVRHPLVARIVDAYDARGALSDNGAS